MYCVSIVVTESDDRSGYSGMWQQPYTVYVAHNKLLMCIVHVNVHLNIHVPVVAKSIVCNSR